MRVLSFGNDLKTTSPTLTERKQKNNRPIMSEREAFGLPKGYTINSISAYYPNIHGLKKEQLFDIQYNSALTLSDGSKLIRPVCLSAGDISITPTENKNEYEVTITRTNGYYDPKKKEDDENKPSIVITKTLSEDELLETKWLSRGKITENKEGKFPYHVEFEDCHGDIKKYNVSKKGCLDILERNALYI